jgi:hypothetical protein
MKYKPLKCALLEEPGDAKFPPWCVSRLEEVLHRRKFVAYDEDPAIQDAKGDLCRAYVRNWETEKLAAFMSSL